MIMKEVIFLFSLLSFALFNSAQTISDSSLIRTLVQANDASKQQILQLNKEVAVLKQQLQKQQQQGFNKFTSTSVFLDIAISSTYNLQALILKESYRNKIATINNPTSNELGFSLEFEIQNALKPLLQKAKNTNASKFGQVVGSLLETGKRSPVSLFPAGNVFTSIVSMVGSLTVKERGIEQQDLDNFIRSIEKYFNQYERLYQSNLLFNNNMEQLKVKLGLLQDDIRLLLQDLIIALDRKIKRQQLKSLSPEDLMLKYFDLKIVNALLSISDGKDEIYFPTDAVKSCKEIANAVQRIYNEYTTIYNTNYQEIKNIIANSKSLSPSVDQIQLSKTIKELEKLYSESKAMDADNIRLKTLLERLDAIVR